MTELRASLDRVQRTALLLGAAAGVLVTAGLFLDRPAFYRAWLVAFLYWIAVPLGSLALVMLHHLTGGSWGFALRRLLEASLRTLPLFALLFLPLLAGRHELYPWSLPGAAEHDPLLAAKAPYLDLPFFVLRAALYFAVWIALALALNRIAARYDRSGDRRHLRRLRALSGPGLVAYGLCATFAAVDWAMSLEPHWFSTIYGVIFIVGQALSTLCFAIVASAWLFTRPPFDRWLSAHHFHDLGKLLFAFVMLWAYVAYSQYLIIWSANLAEETPWYAHRSDNGWDGVAVALIALHFALPFLVLLSRRVKQRPRMLAKVALGLLVARLVDLYWLVLPAFHPERIAFHWLDFAAPLAIGGLWIALFVGQLKGRPLLSLQDAELERALESGAGAAAEGSGP